MANEIGCYYVHLFYPFKLHLKDDSYFEFVFNEKQYILLITRHLKSLIINDFNNRIVRSKEGDKEQFRIENDVQISEKNLAVINEDDVETNTASFVIDYSRNLHKEVYSKEYTEIILTVECENQADKLDIAIEALKHFINSYRLAAKDFLTLNLDKVNFVARVYKEYFHPYTNEEIQIPTIVRMKAARGLRLGVKQVKFAFNNTEWKKMVNLPPNIENRLKDCLSKLEGNSTSDELFLKAQEELFIHQNFKYSFIESWTIIEIEVVSFLRRCKLAKGISKKKVDELEAEVGISYLINIELPLIYRDANEGEFIDLISRLNQHRKLRNKVIHENVEISEEQAKAALQTVADLLKFIHHNNATKMIWVSLAK